MSLPNDNATIEPSTGLEQAHEVPAQKIYKSSDGSERLITTMEPASPEAAGAMDSIEWQGKASALLKRFANPFPSATSPKLVEDNTPRFGPPHCSMTLDAAVQYYAAPLAALRLQQPLDQQYRDSGSHDSIGA